MTSSNSTSVHDTEHAGARWKFSEEALKAHPGNTNPLIDHTTLDTLEHAGQVLELLAGVNLDDLTDRARAGHVYIMSAVQEALAFEVEHRTDIENAAHSIA